MLPDEPLAAPALREERGEGPPRGSTVLLLLLAGLTVVLGALVPLAPVDVDQPVVSWPRAGEQPVSTVLPLVPYRPLALDATVPCGALQDLTREPGRAGDALRTLPASVGESPGEGLTMRVAAGVVSVSASGVPLLAEPVPDGACAYRVIADDRGVLVMRDGQQVASAVRLLVPQVAQLTTDVGTAAAAGPRATVRPDDRYDSSPTPLKTLLLLAHGAALVATLALAAWTWRGLGTGLVRPRFGAADVTFLVVSVAWAVIGPVNYDDAWYSLMARNADEAGYVGNYVYMFNATENPFVASQYLQQLWGGLGGWGLLWLRLLPLAYGVATWFLLRTLLSTSLGRTAGLPWVPWMLLVAHLVWWLPYGMTLRPEPLIVVLAAAVLVFAELARRRRSVGVLSLATAVTALAVTVSPSGVVAAAPLVLTLPWLLPLLRSRGWVTQVTAVVLALAASTAAVPVAFADASLGDVVSATQVHSFYYPTFPWYEEIVHYTTLFANPLFGTDHGSWAKRLPVLLTLALLTAVAIGSGRHVQVGDPVRRLLLGSGVTAAVSLVLLALSPTKWVNHFGAAAAASTVLLATTLLRSPLPRRAGMVATGAGFVVLVGALCLSFAGPNLWRPYSDWGQPFGNHLRADLSPEDNLLLAPNIGPVFLRNPAVWIVVGAVLALGIALWRRSGRHSSMTVDRGVLVLACTGAVVILLAAFVSAPLRQHPAWSVAENNLRATTGDTCGLQPDVQVLLPTGPQPDATGPPLLAGDFALTEETSPPTPVTGGTAVWHTAVAADRAGDATERGTLSTSWYPVPRSGATHVSVPVIAPDDDDGQQVMVQFSTAPVDGPRWKSVDYVAEPGMLTPGLSDHTWQEVWVELATLPLPSRPTAVRVVVEDDLSGEDTWVAVGEPSFTSWQPVTEVIGGEAVFADQLSAPLWPCSRQVGISHGIAGAPTIRLLADELIHRGILNNGIFPSFGGAFVPHHRTAGYVQLASRLDPGPGMRMLPWGEVQRMAYRHPPGLVDVAVTTERRAGWTTLAPLSRDDYLDQTAEEAVRLG